MADEAAFSQRQHARDLLAAIRTLKTVEADGRLATPEEQTVLRRFGGFGAVAIQVFPDPRTGEFKPGWADTGEELAALLTPDEYASAKRSVFNAFYTAEPVMQAVYAGLARLGVPYDAHILEPGCGIGRFADHAPPGMRFTGIELEDLSGRIARLIHPEADIRIEGFQATRIPPVEAAVGNVPFGDVAIRHAGERFSLHDFFFAKTVDTLAPGGVLGFVTSSFTLDKRDQTARQWLANRADFLGAIRLPGDAFKAQGTSVVTDIVFLRKRGPGEEPQHAGDWLGLGTIETDTRPANINEWFAARPDLILGEPSLKMGMHGELTLHVKARPGYPASLASAIECLPAASWSVERAEPRITKSSYRDIAISPGLGEGAFFVTPGGAILQVECGQVLPVMHGQRHLTVNEGKMGQRLGALVQLRDDARHVLRTQNDGLPVAEREAARKALNRSYDRFVTKYGPINKTTYSVLHAGTERETEVRRVPNVARFREDPDAPLVLSLEEYDDATGRAEKAAIMRRDVVGPAEEITSVRSAEEGLLVSLNERGRVDLEHIAGLYGRSPGEIVTELGDLLFHDPDTGEHVTRDAYLSGNVRRALAVAQASASNNPRHRRNVEALLAVQPEDLLPGDIDANLGAPWLPVPVIEAFADEMFGVPAGDVTVRHLPQDALWVVEGRQAMNSVANTADYGTSRIDGLTLLEQALNLKTPTIFDVHPDHSRTVNQTETVAAIEKQGRIKQRFRDWVFVDPDRSEQLVRLYNDGFNNLRLREYDGSHLTFPGMSAAFQPRPHQADVVWRIMCDGNTLMAHCVGGGKTAAAAMACMKLRQTGLARKPICQIPNHMLEQFGREFLQVYPNARILIASKDDLARDRRKLLTAKIATGDWDAIVMTHSSFERIGMSPEFQRDYLQGQIDDYETLLIEAAASNEQGGRASRSILKHLEKRKTALEERLKEMSAERKKDDGLVFDELGVDTIITDEIHLHKNAGLLTKMDRVAGISTTASQRAFDLMMKAAYIDRLTPGRGFIGASGTPISNSMVEMFTMQRYFAPAALRERGIAHFDAWAATFGEVVSLMEISPDGSSLRPNNRFAKFINLPELQQMFRSFADVQTAEMLKLPVPVITGGKPRVVACEMSDAQREIQAGLVERYERIRRGGVRPDDDNALAITTDGRKLALDARLLDANAEDFEGSKVNAAIENIIAIWRNHAGHRRTQLVFSDIGVNPTPWGFSVYHDIRDKLIAGGVPASEIAFIGDANSDAKKEVLFGKVRAGQVRVLLGSTAKMGAGTNVQERLCAIHHLDAPWKPAEIEQRDGRGVRQGNTCPEIELLRNVTKGSFDSFMWQSLETKARFIAQIMKGDLGVRRADDIGDGTLTFAEVKAIATGNPAVLKLAEIEADLQRYSALRRSHADSQYRARMYVRTLPEEIDRLAGRAAGLDADYATAKAGEGVYLVGSRRFADRHDACEAMNERLKPLVIDADRDTHVGSYRGLDLSFSTRKGADPEIHVSGKLSRYFPMRAISTGSLLNRIDEKVADMPAAAEAARQDRHIKISQLAGYEERIGQPFEHEQTIARLQDLRSRLETLLTGEPKDETRAQCDELVAEYAGLTGASAIASPPPLRLVVDHEPATAPTRRAAPAPTRADRPLSVSAIKAAPISQANPLKAPSGPMPTKQDDLFVGTAATPPPPGEGRWAKKEKARRLPPKQIDFGF